MAEHRTTDGTRRRDSRRVKAVLAGGMVLGIGAAITLAAWNDSEFATGTFSAGHFGIEGARTARHSAATRRAGQPLRSASRPASTT